MTAILNSFVADSMMRFRVSTTLNWVYFKQLPVLPPILNDELARLAARLSCTTPELAPYWDAVFAPKGDGASRPDNSIQSGRDAPAPFPWSYASAERDPWRRAELRAELDAIAAELYGLSVEEYARVLTAFPLLDRNWMPLPGDAFLTESEEPADSNAALSDSFPRYLRNDAGWLEARPRSFVTRDFALLTFLRRKGVPPPADLAAWYRDKVGLDPDGLLSRFRVGKVRPLLERVAQARALGAVPYVPSGRGGPAAKDAE